MPIWNNRMSQIGNLCTIYALHVVFYICRTFWSAFFYGIYIYGFRVVNIFLFDSSFLFIGQFFCEYFRYFLCGGPFQSMPDIFQYSSFAKVGWNIVVCNFVCVFLKLYGIVVIAFVYCWEYVEEFCICSLSIIYVIYVFFLYSRCNFRLSYSLGYWVVLGENFVDSLGWSYIYILYLGVFLLKTVC